MSSSNGPTQLLSDSENCTARLCGWVDRISLTDVPVHIKTRMKYLILDSLACGFIGAQLPWSKVAAQGVFDIEASGTCGVLRWSKVDEILSGNLHDVFDLIDRYLESDSFDSCLVEQHLYSRP